LNPIEQGEGEPLVTSFLNKRDKKYLRKIIMLGSGSLS